MKSQTIVSQDNGYMWYVETDIYIWAQISVGRIWGSLTCPCPPPSTPVSSTNIGSWLETVRWGLSGSWAIMGLLSPGLPLPAMGPECSNTWNQASALESVLVLPLRHHLNAARLVLLFRLVHDDPSVRDHPALTRCKVPSGCWGSKESLLTSADLCRVSVRARHITGHTRDSRAGPVVSHPSLTTMYSAPCMRADPPQLLSKYWVGQEVLYIFSIK